MKSLTTPNRFPLIAVLFSLALTGCKAPYYQSENLTARAWVFRISENQKNAVTDATRADGQLQDAPFMTETFLTEPGNHLPPDQFPEHALKQIKTSKNVGLAFSGGGNVAAVCALGQMRALREIDALKKVRYISSVSGGSWFCVPFTFYPGSLDGRNLDTFLGKYVPPERLSWNEQIDCDPPKGSFAWSAAHADLKTPETLVAGYGKENYAHRLSEIYLKPFGSLGNDHKFFCLNRNELKAILERNPQLAEKDFLVAEPDRPFLIANGAISRKSYVQTPSSRWVPFEMTPMYSGAAAFRERSFWPWDQAVGGGYVESFAYDSLPESDWTSDDSQMRKWHGHVQLPAPSSWHYKQSPRFSISDVMATSGAAPTVFWPDLWWHVGFPKFYHWSPRKLGESRKPPELLHTDGGSVDNTGVIPLLRRGVETIVAFVNDQTEVDNDGPKFPDQITALFKDGGRGDLISGLKSHTSQVFNDGSLERLEKQFKSKWLNGGPVIIDENYVTDENPYYGVPQGQHVRIVWVFLGPRANFSPSQKQSAMNPGAAGSCAEWVRTLDAGTYNHIASDPQTLKEFKRFPNFKVFLENPPDIIKLKQRQVNALSQFTSYGVIANRELFLKALSGK